MVDKSNVLCCSVFCWRFSRIFLWSRNQSSCRIIYVMDTKNNVLGCELIDCCGLTAFLFQQPWQTQICRRWRYSAKRWHPAPPTRGLGANLRSYPVTFRNSCASVHYKRAVISHSPFIGILYKNDKSKAIAPVLLINCKGIALCSNLINQCR